MLKKLEDIIFLKMKTNKLAHLIVFEANDESSSDNVIKNFIFNLSHRYFKNFNPQKNFELKNHQDFLLIGEGQDETKEYNKEDFTEVYPFAAHKPLEAESKILVVLKSHLIKDLLANMLLKFFEEPEIPLYIFLANPTGRKLLPTIESRAIKVRIPQEQNSINDASSFQIERGLSYSSFQEHLEATSELNFIKSSIPKITNIEDTNYLLNYIKDFESDLRNNLQYLNDRKIKQYHLYKKLYER